MIKVYCNKLENGNLEITQDMLTDILSYMKRQDTMIKQLKESEEYHRKGFAELYKRIDDVMEYIDEIQEEFIITDFDLDYIRRVLIGDDKE